MKFKVVIETDLNNRPSDYELSAALILARYFKSDIIFLRPLKDKTPDIEVKNMRWEIKSPKGSGKKTIENNLRAARKQSLNIIVDLRRMKMHQTKAIARIHFFLSKPYRFKKVLIITKNSEVVEIL